MSTLDLNIIDVQELNTKEMVELEGGIPIIIGAAAAILIGGFIYESINNYGNMVEALNDGYEAGKEAIKR